MFTVVRVIFSKRGKTTALLTDGRVIYAPKDLEWGSELSADDLVEVDGLWYHKSLVKQKKPKNYALRRDLSGYDASVDLGYIKDFVSILFPSVMGRKFYSQDEFEEVVSYCVEACVRRHVYEKYDPSWPGTYTGYLKTIVFNLLRDYRRTAYSEKSSSLNIVINEHGEELIDFVQATGTDICEAVEHKLLLETLSACVTRLDQEGTGLPGFSYADLFNIMVNGESLDAYLKSFKYPRKLLDEYVSDFRNQLKIELDYAWAVA